MSTEYEKPEISIVVPMHNEEENVRPLYQELTAVLSKLGRSYEILFINDGSTDRTMEQMLELVKSDSSFIAIELEANFGESAALSCGFAIARGEIIVTMDGDLQNNPVDIPRMIDKIAEGWRVVSGIRLNRKEPFFSRRLPSKIANWLIARMTGIPVHDTGCSMKAYRRDVVQGKNLPGGFHRFIPAVFGIRRNEFTEIEIEDRPRKHGKTHYGLSRTFAVLRDLPAIWFINRNSRLFNRIMPLGCLFGLGILAIDYSAPISPGLHWIMQIGGVLIFVASIFITREIHQYNRAQIEKVYRIRNIYCQKGQIP